MGGILCGVTISVVGYKRCGVVLDRVWCSCRGVVQGVWCRVRYDVALGV